jgi:hypothetical protein
MNQSHNLTNLYRALRQQRINEYGACRRCELPLNGTEDDDLCHECAKAEVGLDDESTGINWFALVFWAIMLFAIGAMVVAIL